MNFVLRPHQSCPETAFRVQGELRTHGKTVEWSMIVDGQNWVTDPRFGSDPRKNWELWNFDVVESFLQPRRDVTSTHAPYLELQVSPLNQPLALMILKPRVAVYVPLHLKLEHKVELTPTRWLTTLKVELPEELDRGELHGGLFACLGSGPRSFLALNPNPDERPDFHRPELFVKL